MVSALPFAGWLNERFAEYERDYKEGANGVGAVSRLAREIGFADNVNEDSAARRLYRYRRMVTESARGKHADGKKRRVVLSVTEFGRDVVEEALSRVDPGLFYELYPEHAREKLDASGFEDIVLEPDAWCPHCNEYVTPIDGLCPWCVCEHGHIFREVGITEDGFACLACAKKDQAEWVEARRERDRQRKRLAA